MHRIKNFGKLICHPDDALSAVLERMSVAPQPFQVVVDGDGRLAGTVTDGDVRRALLRGIALDQPVAETMHREPVTGRLGEDGANAQKLSLIARKNPNLAFLPLLDEGGGLREILVLDEPGAALPAVLIMAGGYGKRLGENTRTTPKPLLRVGDGPLLDHVIRRLEEARFADIYVSVHHMSDQIEGFVRARTGKASLQLIREDEPLGTAGAIAHLPAETAGALLVVNGDVLTNVAIAAFVDFHHRLGNDATVAAAQYEHQVPFGVIRHGEDGVLDGIDEKPTIRHYVAAGMYMLSQEMRDLVSPDRPMDMPDLLNAGRSSGLRVGIFPIHEYWTDIGRPEDLSAARENHLTNGSQGTDNA